jgi:polysaccharide pyruvyl transferase WcaK-like protein
MQDARTIVLLDITIADTNLGNTIIMEAVEKQLRSIFREAFFVKVPSFDKIGPISRGLLRSADLIFLCGGNVLTSHPLVFKPWRIGLWTAGLMKRKVITVGVGWLRHKRLSEHWMEPDLYARLLYNLALSNQFYHSVRDNYTKIKMTQLGFKAINTGCPSLWSISDEHCRAIPKEKGQAVVTTVTYYRKDPKADETLLAILRAHYEKIYFWPQQPADIPYFLEIARNSAQGIKILPPDLNVFDNLLKSHPALDYIGTRLHAYIRAVQHGRRAINIQVDDRAKEMAKDFNLTVVPRGKWERLEKLIVEPFETRIRIPIHEISEWKQQFKEVELQDG